MADGTPYYAEKVGDTQHIQKHMLETKIIPFIFSSIESFLIIFSPKRWPGKEDSIPPDGNSICFLNK